MGNMVVLGAGSFRWVALLGGRFSRRWRREWQYTKRLGTAAAEKRRANGVEECLEAPLGVFLGGFGGVRGNGGALATDVEEGCVLLVSIVGVVRLEGAAEGGLEAHYGGKDGLAGFDLALHWHALSVTGGDLHDILEIAVAVGVRGLIGPVMSVDTASRVR